MAPNSHEPTFYLLKRRLPASDSTDLLGRVIRHYQDPTFDYTPESPASSLTQEVFNNFLLGVQHDDTAHFKAKTSRDEKRWAKLKGLISLSLDSAEGGSVEVLSPRITTRRLKMEREYFNALKLIPEVRKKILEMCPFSSKVFLVVGVMSIQTAEFRQTRSRLTDTRAKGKIPVGDATAIAKGVPISTGSVHAGVGRSESANLEMKFNVTATGNDEEAEDVFAIAVKEIRRDWKAFANDVKMTSKRLEYRGGQHFKFGEDEEDEDDSDDEEAQIAAVEAFTLDNSELDIEESNHLL